MIGRTDLICPECKASLVLKRSKYGYFYGCVKWDETGCRGAVGAHSSGEPMGVPVDEETRRLRRRAHSLFDQLWKGDGLMSRTAAYEWMQQKLALEPTDAHIGLFKKPELHKLIRILQAEAPDLGIDVTVGLDKI